MTTIDTTAIRRFSATIAEITANLRLLLGALKDEQQALIGLHPAALEAAVVNKVELLKRLETQLLNREQLLRSMGLPSGHSGTKLLVEQSGNPLLKNHWQEFLTFSEEVETLNRINGQLVTLKERSTREALGILTGRETRPQYYGRRGKHAYSSGSRSGSWGMA